MRQTLAIFHEAYRGLRARKMFWIVLFLSFFVVTSFAFIGVSDKGLTVLTWELEFGPTAKELSPATLYKTMFVTLGIEIWLTWIAAILALISTAGIFPSFIAKGAIDLVVARPISRLRLFLTQYAAGLLFVTLQIAVFCVVSFLVIGVRGGVWEPGLFLAVPLVVCFFSYLYCVCVLLGLLTRSTVAALLLTLLFWFVVFSVHSTETGLLAAKKMAQNELLTPRRGIIVTPGTTRPHRFPDTSPPHVPNRTDAESEEEGKAVQYLDIAYRLTHALKTTLPKTTETIDLLERALIATADLPKLNSGPAHEAQQQVAEELVREFRSRSAWWILGTSLAFEAVILALGGWVFSRRDF